MGFMELWRSWMVEMTTADLSTWPPEDLCVVLAVEFLRVVEGVCWVLDDDQRPALEIHRKARELLCQPEEAIIHGQIAAYSPSLAADVLLGRFVVLKIADFFRPKLTESGL